MLSASWSACVSHEPLPTGWRAALLAAVSVLLLAAPWTDAAGGVDFAARVLLLAVLASAQELVTGRGGVVTLMLGVDAVIGGAGVAVAIRHAGVGLLPVAAGTLAAVVAAVAVDAFLSATTWRAGRWIFTLATLTSAVVLPLLGATSNWLPDGAPLGGDASIANVGGVRFGDALLALASIALWLVLLRLANSPFGRVLPALRDDPRLAEALGYAPARYRALSSAMATVAAVLAGAAFALWQGAGPRLVDDSIVTTLQVLLVGIVGGLGTMWAAPVGAVVVLAAWQALPALLRLGAGRVPDVPWLAAALADASTQRWIMAGLLALLGWMIGGLMVRRRRRF